MRLLDTFHETLLRPVKPSVICRGMFLLSAVSGAGDEEAGHLLSPVMRRADHLNWWFEGVCVCVCVGGFGWKLDLRFPLLRIMPPLLWLQIRDWNWSSQNTCSPLSGPAESSLLFLLPFETFLSRRPRRPARARWLSSADLVEAGCSRSATWISPSILTTMLPNLLWYPIGCLTWGNLQLWLCKRSSGGNTWLSPHSFRSSEDPDHSEWSLRQDGFYNTSAVF